LAYAEQANAEYYVGIAHLFVALAASDSVHLHNFQNCLLDLGIEKKEPLRAEIQVLSTKKNLRRAVELELLQVEHYSQYLEKIKVEKHKVAIEKVWYALESEKQHREHLKRIQKYTGFGFELLANYMEIHPVRYYICQTCGYTLTDLPEKSCPVCNRPVSQYREVGRMSNASS
jgi:rubrerythrin